MWNEIISPCSPSRVSCFKVASSEEVPLLTHRVNEILQEVAQKFTNKRAKKRPRAHRHKAIMHRRKLWRKSEEQTGATEDELVAFSNKRKDYSSERLLFFLSYSIAPFSLLLPLTFSLHGFNGALSQSSPMNFVMCGWKEYEERNLLISSSSLASRLVALKKKKDRNCGIFHVAFDRKRLICTFPLHWQTLCHVAWCLTTWNLI